MNKSRCRRAVQVAATQEAELYAGARTRGTYHSRVSHALAELARGGAMGSAGADRYAPQGCVEVALPVPVLPPDGGGPLAGEPRNFFAESLRWRRRLGQPWHRAGGGRAGESFSPLSPLFSFASWGL